MAAPSPADPAIPPRMAPVAAPIPAPVSVPLSRGVRGVAQPVTRSRKIEPIANRCFKADHLLTRLYYSPASRHKPIEAARRPDPENWNLELYLRGLRLRRLPGDQEGPLPLLDHLATLVDQSNLEDDHAAVRFLRLAH